ncbi:hypothetical protein TEA_009815 [Camellia sinensis var. sinensis]|uniref:non-specific serine/threonine protein kinase n=1 Tax=Camellia sinensis var. sinensis TaxID=542762 RepID=A0A4S4EK17_CAMSN|nr:hypothetical protein TEA_009815 [Camellia sinensis var. sinensis]
MNKLTGSIPSSIGNLGNLTLLYLYDNQLSESIPQEVGMLRSLIDLELSGNNLTGSIPASIGNLSNLAMLYLNYNRLFGSIPSVFNNLTHLTEFIIDENMFNGHIPEGLCFNGLLVNFTANDNNLTGPIPKSLRNCSSLYRVRLDRNQISGNISEDFGLYPSLDYIDLSHNNFYGELSKNWGKCHNLTSLKMSNNKISGRIPSELVGATQLSILDLSSNHLFGEIPLKLGRLVSLFNLKLDDNYLLGNIPPELSKLSNLENLNLAANNLSGSIPRALGECKKLWNLNLSNNRFGESIPIEIGQINTLQSLDLGNNLLIEGPLPDIKAFQEAPFKALKGNKGLCGNATGLKACLTKLNNGDAEKKGKKVMKVRNTKNEPSRVNHDNVFAIWSYDGKMVYESIIEVTKNFSAKCCVGEGGYGTVYRAVLPNGQVVAVTKLHATLDDDLVNLKGFASEIRALTKIRHHNIVKLYGYCVHPRHSFLVYEFLEAGSLGKVLSMDDDLVVFDWIKRVNTVKGVANALSYMHHDCFQPIIHRDISSKNVLFDLEYVAHISDFGTARFMNLNSSNWTSFAGTFGYAAPDGHSRLTGMFNITGKFSEYRWKVIGVSSGSQRKFTGLL